MNKVDLIYPGYIYAPNGASTVIRLLYESKDLFLKSGVECQFFSKDVTSDNLGSHNNSCDEKKNMSLAQRPLSIRIKHRLINEFISFLNIIPTNNASKAFLKIYRGHLLPSKRIAKEFIKKHDRSSSNPVFIHDIFTCYYYLKYRKSNRPILLVLHNNGESFKMLTFYYPEIINSWVIKKFLKFEKMVLDEVSRIVFVSHNSKIRFLDTHSNVAPEKVSYVYNGLPDKFIEKKSKMNEKSFEICCVASITDRKGQDIIIDSLLKLSYEERNRLHFTFVGDGYLRDTLEKKCKYYGVDKYVDFVGNQKNVDTYLAKSDIFILPSRDEGLPMAIIEAQRAKLPVISTYVAGIPEMIDNGISGLLFNPVVDELVDILKNITRYNWEEMGNRSYETYKNKFTLNAMVSNYSNILNELVVNPCEKSID